MDQIFSNNLRRLRQQKQLTQEQAAEQLGVSAQSISRWECGTTLPDVMLLPQIARLYCVTVDDLYREQSSVYANYAQRLASLYEHTGKPEDFFRAEQEFRRLFERGEGHSDDRRMYGIIHHYMMKDCMRIAAETFDRLIAEGADGDRETLFRTRGQRIALMADIGRNAESIAALQQEIEAGRTDAQTYALLLAACCRDDDLEAAYNWFQQAAERHPTAWMLYAHGGEICKRLGRWDEAFACWDRAIELEPKAFDAKCAKASACEELGDDAQAYRLWQSVAEDLKADGFEYEIRSVLERAEQCRKRSLGV